MTEQDRPGGAQAQPGEGLAAGEPEDLAYALETRFATHLGAASLMVREAERGLAEARENLARAEHALTQEGYSSDPLTFMRESVREEVEALGRKTTPKKVRTSYRFLLDRAVELAAAEVQGFHDDRAAEQQERDSGVEACLEAVRRAAEALEAARLTQERVRQAQQSARQGLDVLLEKLTVGEPQRR